MKDKKAQLKASSHHMKRHLDLKRDAWEYPALQGISRPPSAMTITTVNQCQQLEQIHDIEVAHAPGVTSHDWLQNHSLSSQELSFNDILKQGIPLRPQISDIHGKPVLHLKYYASKLSEYKAKLGRFIQICEERVKWLMKDSRRAFGLVKAQRPCILLDTSDTNCGFGRLQLLQESLKKLIYEQLSKMEKLYVAAFGTYLEPLWNTQRDVNGRILQEMAHWVDHLHSSGSCNVLGALQQLIKWNVFDTFVLILGNSPNQQPENIIDFIIEAIAGKDVPFHTVGYNCSISATEMFLRNLAQRTGGQYHCYSTTNEEQIMAGSDLMLLSSEIERAKDTLYKIQKMIDDRQVDSLRITVIDQPCLEIVGPTMSTEIAIPSDDFAVRPTKGAPFPAGTSADWLKENSLRAKGLTLYQVIAPNTYSYVNGYIPSINKDVKSQVHHKCMVQFEWHDGSVKNVHVDPVLLFEYQHALQNTIHLYRRRIEWLMSGSRKLFGNLIEERIVLLIDMSYTMAGEIVQLRSFVKELLEEQLHGKIAFNIICIGGCAVRFKPTMVEPTKQTLKEAWRWFLNQTCTGSRKFLEAFRLTLENDDEIKHNIDVEGVYLISSGIPDEAKDIACSYVEETIAGRYCSLHCIYLEPLDNDPRTIVGQYADTETTVQYFRELASSGRGRFHWVKENVVVESEDIRNIVIEMEKAHNYTKKAEMLLDSIKRKDEDTKILTNENNTQLVPRPPAESKTRPKGVRQTQLSQARLNGARPGSASAIQSSKRVRDKERPNSSKHSETGSIRSVAWRPNTLASSTNIIPPTNLGDGHALKSVIKEHVVKPVERVFYTELGNQTGVVQEALTSPTQQKSGTNRGIPDKEDFCTTKEWMQNYSLSKLGLDVNKVLETSICSHGDKGCQMIPSGPRHCNIFPTVTIKGVTKHIHVKAHELQEYCDKLEKVLTRYTKRTQWLLSGSRRIFGTIVEKNVVILVDTSGSMVSHLDDLKKELCSLLQDQIQKHHIRFTIMKFSSSVEPWTPKLMKPTDQYCRDAELWISRMEAYGGTNTLEALRAALEEEEVDGIYLLTDGKPDQSSTSVLREAAVLNAERKAKIHTISFNCNDSSANNFLRLLASQTGGRYHRFQETENDIDTSQQLLETHSKENQTTSVPSLEGDDLKRLCREISLCRKYIKYAKSIREAMDISDSSKYTELRKDEVSAR